MKIKYMPGFKNINGSHQYEKVLEEVEEAKLEYIFGEDEEEDQEIADAIQALVTRWMQKGKTKEDIDKIWEEHYKKEKARGREIIDIL